MIKNSNTIPTISLEKNTPISKYVEFFLEKYKILSCLEITLLIYKNSNSEVFYKDEYMRLKKNVSVNLNTLKKEGKAKKVENMKWKWIDTSE